MRYVCAVFDYDGTLAKDSHVLPSTVEALKKLRESSRRLILATGRQLRELLEVFPEAATLFDYIVAENGGVLYKPSTRDYRVLTEPPSSSPAISWRRSPEDVVCLPGWLTG